VFKKLPLLCIFVCCLSIVSQAQDWIDCGTPDTLTGGLATLVPHPTGG